MTSSIATRCALAIETSNPSSGAGGVCVGVRDADGRRQVLAAEGLAPKRRHDDALMPAIESAVRAAGLAPRDLNRVAVSIGPGGFTGLRVAVATAKMIAESTGAECVAVPTALALAAAHDSAIVALASKRETAWVAALKGGVSMPERFELALAGEVMNADRFGAALRDHPDAVIIADAYVPESLRLVTETTKRTIAPPEFSAEACLDVSWELAAVDAVQIAPLYPREPEAVSKWRELHG